MRTETVLDHAVVTLYADGCYSTFRDGATWAAQPHDTFHYRTIAWRCGYRQGTAEARRRMYCLEHEVFHHVVGAVFYGGPSPVLWGLAHCQPVTDPAAALEEAMVMTLQRWVRAGERPIIGGVDWDGLRAQCLALLDT